MRGGCCRCRRLQHVKGLDLTRVLRDEDGHVGVGGLVVAELLGEVPFVLRLEAGAPDGLVLEAVRDGPQHLDGVGVGDARPPLRHQHAPPATVQLVLVDEVGVGETLGRVPGVGAVALELGGGAQAPESRGQRGEHPLGEVHDVVHVCDEAHLGLEHVELAQVARGVALLGAKRGRERPHVADGLRERLEVQLRRHGEVLWPAEEVPRTDAKGLAGALAVRRRDDGRVRLLELLAEEELREQRRGVGPEPQQRRVERRPRAKMRDGAQTLWRLVLVLDRVCLWKCVRKLFFCHTHRDG